MEMVIKMKLFFEKLVLKMDLGELLKGPDQVGGGLTHRMFKIVTSKGKYIIKLLNPNIMKRPTALSNFNRADEIEEVLKRHGIDAIYSLEFHNQKMQLINDQYFYVYEWFDGKSLKDNEITKLNCRKIGKALAQIHNIDLKEEKYIGEKKYIDWNYYVEKAKTENIDIYHMIYDKIDILNESINKGNEVVEDMPNVVTICHNDLDSKNVLWLDDEYKIIDLECLGYSNPYLELFELALCWSGYENCNINFDLFHEFMNSYFEHTKLDTNINWKTIYYANNGRMEWLEYNLRRALLIECSSEEEQKIGIHEVKETLEHIIYYDKMKDEMLLFTVR